MASTASLPVYMMPGVPVHQPSHLEGDASLATEILPGPPSLLAVQQSVQKRDPKKPSTVYSYLPPSDPGSTYSGLMHGTLVGQELDAPRAKRDKNAATGRAQRASARHQNGATSATDHHPLAYGEVGVPSLSQPITVDSEPSTMAVDDEPSISRSNSLNNLQEGPSASATARPRRKDKGKGKETDFVRVKEEPKAISLHSPEPIANLVNNEDHCSSCRSHGALVYCDGCPRAFHLWCLDPPMESVDEGDSRWFCPGCVIGKHPPRKPAPSFLAPLVQSVQSSIPTEYQLPDDVRTFFKDVGTGPKGSYVDTSEIKQPRLNRHGQLEERDAHRLRDRNGDPVLCFKCGTSALAEGIAATAPATKRARRATAKAASVQIWKSIISCDYCGLHWHLDCLDPPLPVMPSFSKKWMCPNHADRVLAPKRRIPKQTVPPLEITKPKQFNNGNIEIIRQETSSTTPTTKKVPVDEVLINGRRYRVPERILVLDFWSKVSKKTTAERASDIDSRMSSPLTSLSSLEDVDDSIPPLSAPMSYDPEDLKAAQMLCNLRAFSIGSALTGSRKNATEKLTQTDTDVALTARSRAVNKLSSSAKRASTRPSMNGSSRTQVNQPMDSISTQSGPSTSTAKRKRTANGTSTPVVEPSTRELRSRSKNESSLTSISSKSSIRHADDFSFDSPSTFGMPKPPIRVKMEEAENGILPNGFGLETPTTSSKAAPRRTRAIRRPARYVEENGTQDMEPKGKKRKEREDELDELDAAEALDPSYNESTPRKVAKPRGRETEKKRKSISTPRKQTRIPSTPHAAAPTSSTIPPSAPPSSVSVPVTPSLKIRLPRLSDISLQTTSPAPIPSGHT